MRKTVGLSQDQFGLVPQTFDCIAEELLSGAEMFRISSRCECCLLAIFFIGSTRDRIARQHHASRNLPA